MSSQTPTAVRTGTSSVADKPAVPEVTVQTPSGGRVTRAEGSPEKEVTDQVPGLLTDGDGIATVKKTRSAKSRRSSAKSRAETTDSKLARTTTPAEVIIYDDDESIQDSDYDTDLEVEETRDEFDPTGRKAYKEACLELGIVPVSFILEHITNEHLSINHHGLGTSGAKALVAALMNNTTTSKLNIRDCHIAPEGGVEVAKLLKENFYITELDISQNKIKSDGAQAFSEVLQENSTLTSLNMSWSEFKNQDSACLADAIRNNHTLKKLDLSKNKFEEDAGLQFGPALDANDGLEHLSFKWNHLRGPGAVAIGKGLRANCSLMVLDISWNGFADEGAHAVGESLRENNTLIELDMSYNRISTKGAMSMAEGLKVNNTLKILKIGMNPIQDAGAYAILNAMKNNAECAMEKLYLNSVVIDLETQDLIKMIHTCRPNFEVSCTHSKRSGNLTNQLDDIFSGKGKKKRLMELINKLKEYVEKMNYRLVDLFRQFDKDNSLSVSREEFYNGLKGIGVPMTDKELTQLIDLLDEDGDGEIDFSEFTWIREAEEEEIELSG